jgi:thiosulfate/3-mercaptopyruvate sulfurtransferase
MTTSTSPMPKPLVSTEWLAAHLDDPDLRILDCTIVQKQTPDGSYAFGPGAEAYEESHIPGAVFVNVMQELRDPDNPLPLMMPQPAHFAETMSRIGVGEGTKVVIYDRGNHNWAARVWWSLRVMGFDDASVLDGGWQKWTAEGHPVSSEATSYPRGDFRPAHRPALMVAKDEVLAAIGDDEVLIIHALSPAEFTGDVVRLPRPGRITGSVNVASDSLVDKERFAYLPLRELKARFDAQGAGQAGRIITYCGGGVAACSDALALTALGFENVAVYDGSLTEWTADPDAPMETG